MKLPRPTPAVCIGVVAAIILGAFAVFVWPTPYQYYVLRFKDHDVLVGVNTLTGQSYEYDPEAYRRGEWARIEFE